MKGWGGVIGEGRENCFEQLTHPSPNETPSNRQFKTSVTKTRLVRQNNGDYYLGKEASLFEDLEAMREINTFDWQDSNKGFGAIFEVGGFDCVIGNPPYISAPTQIESSKLKLQREYLASCGKYKSLYQKWDLYIPFIEKGLNILKNGGIYGAIIPYPFTNQTYGKILRETILKDYNLLEVVDLKGTKVFEHATVTNCIPIIKKDVLGGG